MKQLMYVMRATEQILIEHYYDDTIGLSIVQVICIATFINREPGITAPLLFNMLHVFVRSVPTINI